MTRVIDGEKRVMGICMWETRDGMKGLGFGIAIRNCRVHLGLDIGTGYTI